MSWIKNIIVGALIGVANIIPGFSGGTIAYMTGIYEKLLKVISDYLPNKEKKRVQYTFFLMQIGLSAFLAIVLLSKPMVYITETPLLAQHFYFFVIGAILGSIAIVVRYEEEMSPSISKFMIFFMTIGVFLFITYKLNVGGRTELPSVTKSIMGLQLTAIDLPYYTWLFVIGIFAAGSMVLPGFSGSALLMSLGEYSNILEMISQRMIIPLGIFALGCGLGILLLAKVLTVLLQKYKGGTQYFIMGLMVASIYRLIQEIGTFNMAYLITSALLLVGGCGVAYYIGLQGQKK